MHMQFGRAKKTCLTGHCSLSATHMGINRTHGMLIVILLLLSEAEIALAQGCPSLTTAVVASVFGTLGVVAIVAAVVIYLIRRRKKKNGRARTVEEEDLHEVVTEPANKSAPAVDPAVNHGAYQERAVDVEGLPANGTLRYENGNKDQVHTVVLDKKKAPTNGFNIVADDDKNIFIRDVRKGGPAEGKLIEGDIIESVTVFYDGIAYEDALNVLSYAAPYKVAISLVRGQNHLMPGYEGTKNDPFVEELQKQLEKRESQKKPEEAQPSKEAEKSDTAKPETEEKSSSSSSDEEKATDAANTTSDDLKTEDAQKKAINKAGGSSSSSSSASDAEERQDSDGKKQIEEDPAALYQTVTPKPVVVTEAPKQTAAPPVPAKSKLLQEDEDALKPVDVIKSEKRSSENSSSSSSSDSGGKTTPEKLPSQRSSTSSTHSSGKGTIPTNSNVDDTIEKTSSIRSLPLTLKTDSPDGAGSSSPLQHTVSTDTGLSQPAVSTNPQLTRTNRVSLTDDKEEPEVVACRSHFSSSSSSSGRRKRFTKKKISRSKTTPGSESSSTDSDSKQSNKSSSSSTKQMSPGKVARRKKFFESLSTDHPDRSSFESGSRSTSPACEPHVTTDREGKIVFRSGSTVREVDFNDPRDMNLLRHHSQPRSPEGLPIATAEEEGHERADISMKKPEVEVSPHVSAEDVEPSVQVWRSSAVPEAIPKKEEYEAKQETPVVGVTKDSVHSSSSSSESGHEADKEASSVSSPPKLTDDQESTPSSPEEKIEMPIIADHEPNLEVTSSSSSDIDEGKKAIIPEHESTSSSSADESESKSLHAQSGRLQEEVTKNPDIEMADDDVDSFVIIENKSPDSHSDLEKAEELKLEDSDENLYFSTPPDLPAQEPHSSDFVLIGEAEKSSASSEEVDNKQESREIVSKQDSSSSSSEPEDDSEVNKDDATGEKCDSFFIIDEDNIQSPIESSSNDSEQKGINKIEDSAKNEKQLPPTDIKTSSSSSSSDNEDTDRHLYEHDMHTCKQESTPEFEAAEQEKKIDTVEENSIKEMSQPVDQEINIERNETESPKLPRAVGDITDTSSSSSEEDRDENKENLPPAKVTTAYDESMSSESTSSSEYEEGQTVDDVTMMAKPEKKDIEVDNVDSLSSSSSDEDDKLQGDIQVPVEVGENRMESSSSSNIFEEDKSGKIDSSQGENKMPSSSSSSSESDDEDNKESTNAMQQDDIEKDVHIDPLRDMKEHSCDEKAAEKKEESSSSSSESEEEALGRIDSSHGENKMPSSSSSSSSRESDNEDNKELTNSMQQDDIEKEVPIAPLTDMKGCSSDEIATEKKEESSSSSSEAEVEVQDKIYSTQGENKMPSSSSSSSEADNEDNKEPTSSMQQDDIEKDVHVDPMTDMKGHSSDEMATEKKEESSSSSSESEEEIPDQIDPSQRENKVPSSSSSSNESDNDDNKEPTNTTQQDDIDKDVHIDPLTDMKNHYFDEKAAEKKEGSSSGSSEFDDDKLGKIDSPQRENKIPSSSSSSSESDNEDNKAPINTMQQDAIKKDVHIQPSTDMKEHSDEMGPEKEEESSSSSESEEDVTGKIDSSHRKNKMPSTSSSSGSDNEDENKEPKNAVQQVEMERDVHIEPLTDMKEHPFDDIKAVKKESSSSSSESEVEVLVPSSSTSSSESDSEGNKEPAAAMDQNDVKKAVYIEALEDMEHSFSERGAVKEEESSSSSSESEEDVPGKIKASHEENAVPSSNSTSDDKEDKTVPWEVHEKESSSSSSESEDENKKVEHQNLQQEPEEIKSNPSSSSSSSSESEGEVLVVEESVQEVVVADIESSAPDPDHESSSSSSSESSDANEINTPEIQPRKREDIVLTSGWRKAVKLLDLIRARLVVESTVKKLEFGEVSEEEVQEGLKQYLVGDEPIAGLIKVDTGEKISLHAACQDGIIRRGTALSLLEAQAATGSIIDPITAQKMSVKDAVSNGLVDRQFQAVLERAERAVHGYKSRLSPEPLSIFEAMKRDLVVENHGIRLLEAQIATGGIIDPNANHRLPVEVAFERGLFDERLQRALEDPSDDTKGFFDPNTKENLTYLELMQRCVLDKDTNLRLLPLFDGDKKREYSEKHRSGTGKRSGRSSLGGASTSS